MIPLIVLEQGMLDPAAKEAVDGILANAGINPPPVESLSHSWKCVVRDRSGRAYEIDGVMANILDSTNENFGKKVGVSTVYSDLSELNGQYEVFDGGISFYELYYSNNGWTYLINLNLPFPDENEGNVVIKARGDAKNNWEVKTLATGFCTFKTSFVFGTKQ